MTGDLSRALQAALFDFYRLDMKDETAQRWSGEILRDFPRMSEDELKESIRFAATNETNRSTRNDVSVAKIIIWIKWYRKEQRVARDGYRDGEPQHDEMQTHSELRRMSPRDRWDCCCKPERVGDARERLVSWCLANGLDLERPSWPTGCLARSESGRCDASACGSCDLVTWQRVRSVSGIHDQTARELVGAVEGQQ